MVTTRTAPIVMEHSMSVYWNLVHNVLCCYYDDHENVEPLTTKRTHVKMYLDAPAKGLLPKSEWSDVQLQFGEHEIAFDKLMVLLMEHYEVSSDTNVTVTLRHVGRLQSPMGQSMHWAYRTQKDW